MPNNFFRSFAGRLRPMQLATALGVVAMLGACSLPGYQSNPVKGDSWYDFGGNNETTYQKKLDKKEVDYDARIVKITPGLIRHQQKKSAAEELPADMKAVTAKAPHQAYQVGPGDVLKVIVYGQQDINNPTGSNNRGNASGQVVSADGAIYFPYVGTMQVAGKTPAEIRREITKKISSVIRKPQVDVRVKQYRSKRIYISGDIRKPCTVSLTDVTNTVLQALDQCNTLSSGQSASDSAAASGVQNVVLIRDGKSTFLDLNAIYAAGNPVPLEPGDRLLVDDSANRVFMMGEFNKQTALPFSTGGMSLSDAVSDAGGVNLDTANVSKIYVVRGFVDSQSVVDGQLQTVMRPNVYKLDMDNIGGMLLANEFQLKPRDIVFAAPASMVNFNRALSQITPSLNILLQSVLLYDRSSRR